MKVLVYGSKGWIGQQVIDELKKQNIDFIEGTERAENTDNLEKEILEVNPTHIMSFIGRTHGPGYTTIDYLEQPGKIKENVRDNLYSPITLAILSKKHNIHYTYLGTGCIFEYEGEKQIFTEEDVPNFFGSSYSVVKGYTDRLMHLFDNVLNVRIRMPITNLDNPRNFITKITSYKKICSIANSMTVLPELIPIMIDLARNNNSGTINLTNPGVITHNEILDMYKEIIDPSFTWENFSIEEQDQILASKRSNNYLDTTKLEELYPLVLPIKDAVRQCLINWNK
jgi:dTDP-4-dehydrorhamnose reductase